MDSQTHASESIVLVHGLWRNPRSWEKWVARYEDLGYQVIAPPYPRLESDVGALNADPSPLEQLTVFTLVEGYERIIRGFDEPPILMGHSFGGLIVQILLDRGLGAAGVAIDSGTPAGVLTLPLVLGCFKNYDRAPLLLIGGDEGHVNPLALNKANFKHYKRSTAITELKAFPGRMHYTLGLDGWEEVADYALNWSTEHARTAAQPAMPAA